MKLYLQASLLSLAGSTVLLGGGSALAATNSFTVDLDKAFDNSYSGVTGIMDFVFGDAGDSNANTYTLDLTIKNTSSAPIDSSSLTGFGFDTPTGVTSLVYDRNGTKFYQATKTPLTIGPAPSFNFCAFTDKTTSNGTDCGSGFPQDGLANGQSATVKYTFNFAGTNPGVNDVSTAFFNLFNGVVISPPPNANLASKTSVVLAARFQAINSKTLGLKGDSDMITGKPKVKPDDGPGDAVPGPLPVLGAAAAFVQSRRLRRRLAPARSVQQHPA